MAEIPVSLGQSVQANPGDTFRFKSSLPGIQYRFSVSPPSGSLVIGMWKNQAVKGNGVARSKQGLSYVDHSAGIGTFIITVDGATLPYQMTASTTPNSFIDWLKKLFGF
jgi:hypothetical protein